MSRVKEVSVNRIGEPEFDLFVHLPAPNDGEPTQFIATDRARIPAPRVEKIDFQIWTPLLGPQCGPSVDI